LLQLLSQILHVLQSADVEIADLAQSESIDAWLLVHPADDSSRNEWLKEDR